ncbi:MAG: hypothetical protein ABR530_10030 [Pyrinomonadaceae bacterium]
MNKFRHLIVAVMVLAACITGAAQKPKADQELPATTTIHSTDDVGTFFRFQSDGLGTYANGVNSVKSLIQPIGDWEMDATLSTIRKVYIDFGDPVVAGDTTAPFASAILPARFISKCSDRGYKMRDLALGQVVTCPLAVRFDYGGKTYRINMNPVNNATTNYMQWTCTAVANLRCTAWTGTPSATQATGELKNRARLIRVGTSRKDPDQLLGEFYFSFKLGVTTP